MSSNNINPAEVLELILGLETTFYEIATLFVLWGLHISLACFSVYLLWNRGLRSSLPRQCLSGIVILMLVASTSYAALTINFYLMQLPSILDREAQAALVPKLKKYNIAANWLSRLNYCLSDLIVVWRAWVLWSDSRPVRWMLGIVMTITTICTATNAIVMTISSLGSPTEAGPNGLLLPESALRALLFIPLMATNVLATLLISYTAWVYRRTIQFFTTKSSGNGNVLPVFRSSFRVGRTLGLLIETGVLYIVLMTINIVKACGVFQADGTPEGFMFSAVWSHVIMEISAIYPTVIIILVSKFVSQEDAIHSSATNHQEAAPKGNARTHRAEWVNETGALSAIRFDMSQLASQIENHEKHSKEGERLSL